MNTRDETSCSVVPLPATKSACISTPERRVNHGRDVSRNEKLWGMLHLHLKRQKAFGGLWWKRKGGSCVVVCSVGKGKMEHKRIETWASSSQNLRWEQRLDTPQTLVHRSAQQTVSKSWRRALIDLKERVNPKTNDEQCWRNGCIYCMCTMKWFSLSRERLQNVRLLVAIMFGRKQLGPAQRSTDRQSDHKIARREVKRFCQSGLSHILSSNILLNQPWIYFLTTVLLLHS